MALQKILTTSSDAVLRAATRRFFLCFRYYCMPPRNAAGKFTKSPTPGPSNISNTMTTPSALDIAALIDALKPVMAAEIATAVTAAVSTAVAAATPIPPPNPPLPTAQPGPPQQYSQTTGFVGPLTGNQAAGASIHLMTEFPEVEEAVIISVITHQFRGSDLYKLDSKYRDKADRSTLEFENGAVRVKTDASVKEYPTPLSVELPLMVYFRILIAHAVTTGDVATVALATSAYTESFLRLRAEYEWPAVLAYHMAFFARRRREMAQGSYGGWKHSDAELQTDHLLGFRKARTAAASAHSRKTNDSGSRTTEACRLFNLGHCTTPCRNGRTHKCSTCSKGDHGATTCSTNANRA